MIPHQHLCFIEGWAHEHRKRLLTEAELYRRMKLARRKRSAFGATCCTLGQWLVAWGTWLVDRYSVVDHEPGTVSVGSAVSYKTI